MSCCKLRFWSSAVGEVYYIAFAFVCVFAASVFLLVLAIALNIWLRREHGLRDNRLGKGGGHDYCDRRNDVLSPKNIRKGNK